MLLHLRKDFSWTSVCQKWTPAGNFVQNWSRLSNYLMFLNIICYMHYLLLFMISLDHPCEIENGVLKYTFLWLRNNADYCCISSHEDILLLQRAIAHSMLLCVGGHNNIFLFMRGIFMVHMSVSQRWVTQQLNYWCSSSYFVIFCMLSLLTLVINTQLSGHDYEMHLHQITSLHSISLNVKLT